MEVKEQEGRLLTAEKTYLSVPYAEKDSAKGLGARWDPGMRKWYVPPGQSLRRFSRWIDGPLPMEQEVPGETSKGLPLSELLVQIREKVCQVTPAPLWVKAEIADIKKKRWGDIYLDLCETDNGQQLAKVSAKLGKHHASTILDKCREAGVSLKTGVSALIQVKADFHLQYGVSLQVLDIDPAFTLGELEAKRKKVLKRLADEGMADRNKRLEQPRDFCAVAVICPDRSAALGDFKREAGWLEGFGLCSFHYFTAVFQGPTASASICSAFEKAADLARSRHVDAVAFIRGGGATTDLAWLDDFDIARAICLSGVPVFTGLGHEKNISVADLVSNRAFDTPSKVSLHIKESILEEGKRSIAAHSEICRITRQLHLRMAERTDSLQAEGLASAKRTAAAVRKTSESSVREIFLQSGSIVQKARWISDGHSQVLGSALRLQRAAAQELRAQKLVLEARPESALQDAGAKLREVTGLIGFHGRGQLQEGLHGLHQYNSALHLAEGRIKRAGEKARHLMGLVLSREPGHILKHGFAVVRTTAAKAVTSRAAALQEEELVLLFKDGAVRTRQPEPHGPEKGESNER